MKRGELKALVLERLLEGAERMDDLVDFLIFPPHGKSFRGYAAHVRARSRLRDERKVLAEARHRALNFIGNLRREGLLSERCVAGELRAVVTASGRKKLRKLTNHLSERFESAPDADRMVIVIFDIPERYRGKRALLRQALSDLGLTYLQRSVWIGRKEIPASFIAFLETARIIRYVEIFSVSDSGTLSPIL